MTNIADGVSVISTHQFVNVTTADNDEIISRIAGHFTCCTPCKTAALVSTAYYLGSTADYYGASVSEFADLSRQIYRGYRITGDGLIDTEDEFVARVEQHYLEKQKNPWHLSIDRAIWEASEWINGKGVPAEVRYVVRESGIRSQGYYAAICVAWALQQLGNDWFLDSRTFEKNMKRHGITAGVSGRGVLRVLKRLRDRGLIETTAPHEFLRSCNRYRFSLPTGFEDPGDITLTRGRLAFSEPDSALLPFYSFSLDWPSPDKTLQETATGASNDYSPLKDQSHSGHKSRTETHSRHNESKSQTSPYATADKKAVMAEAVGRWPEIIEAVIDRDLERSQHQKYVTCPVCSKKRKATVRERDGATNCYRCGKIGSNGFDTISAFTGMSFHRSLTAVAEYLGVEGKPRRGDRLKVSAYRPPPMSGAETIMEDVASLKGISVEGLQHYGTQPATRRYKPNRDTILNNAVARIPQRLPSGTETSYLDIGTACPPLKKGLCPEGQREAGVFLPNDYDADDGKPVVLTEGPKDAIRGWELQKHAHVIGLQDGRIPDALMQTLKGRDVMFVADNDDAGQQKAESVRDWCNRNGVRVQIRTCSGGKGAGIRDMPEVEALKLLSFDDGGPIDVIPTDEMCNIDESTIDWAASAF